MGDIEVRSFVKRTGSPCRLFPIVLAAKQDDCKFLENRPFRSSGACRRTPLKRGTVRQAHHERFNVYFAIVPVN